MDQHPPLGNDRAGWRAELRDAYPQHPAGCGIDRVKLPVAAGYMAHSIGDDWCGRPGPFDALAPGQSQTPRVRWIDHRRDRDETLLPKR